MKQKSSSPLTREQLYEEVWAEPIRTVAVRYEVSGSYLTRVCKRLNIPRPPMGYWAKLKVGKAPARPDLPAARPGDELEWSRDGTPRREPPGLPKAPETLSKWRQRDRPGSSPPSPVLAGAREHFLAGTESSVGHLRPRKKLIVDICVTRSTLDRALRTANALFLALEKRGHQITFAPSDRPYSRPALDERIAGSRDHYVRGAWNGPDRPTVVVIGTVAIGLTLYEPTEKVQMRHVGNKAVRVDQLPPYERRRTFVPGEWDYTEDVPTGLLCLRASSPYWRAKWERQWPETRPETLPSKIPAIIRELEAEASTIAKLVEEGERQAEIERKRWEEQRIESERKEAERRRLANIEASREQLFAIIEDWGVAKRVEGFFEDAERRAAGLGTAAREVLRDRLDVARQLLGDIDALKRFQIWRTPEEH